ncbi:hypothetical protein HPB47_003015 [Ixodes persulcatus]|uniref:Uncharacterized protein n=1 Tax=Ixodes persulcatus TaxID=34615 RepID=A0AC60PJL3_IXOPE|nr:hypothetical protein HPB47_003015 [Ixodes persulcatus]
MLLPLPNDCRWGTRRLSPLLRAVPVTTWDPLEVDLGLLHQAGLGLLSEGPGDSVGLPPVRGDAAAARSSAVSSTGSCQVPGHGSLQDLESNPRRTTWSSRLRRRPRRLRLAILRARSHGARTQHMDILLPGSLWDRLRPPPCLVKGWGKGDLVVGGQLCTPGSGNPEPYRKPPVGEVPPRHLAKLRVRCPTTEGRGLEALLRALREAVEEEPSETFQGERLWAVAREAISGVDYLRPINDYIRDVVFLDHRRSPPQSSRRRLARESRRRRRRREYTKTQEMFHKRPADCAREVLAGPAEAGVEDVRGRRGGVDRDLRELLESFTRAPLKPQQRLFILRGFLLPRLHHSLVLGLWGIGTLSKLDRMTRAAIRKWLALPHDTPGLRFSDYPGREAALRCRMLMDQVRQARQAASLNGVPLSTKAEVHKYWADKLHSNYDGAALRDTRHVPAAQSWISYGTRLLPGRHYVNVIKLRVNALPTLSRTKRGRPDDVSCKASCRARESLGHVLQACRRGHRGRVNVQRKVMKPDLVATKGAQTIIIDVQVVGTGKKLAFLHQQKAAKYTVPNLLRQVQGKQKEPPLVTTATMNFRGIWSKDSARDLLSLGLTKSDLKLMTVRCLQGGLRCFWGHRGMTTAAVTQAVVLGALPASTLPAADNKAPRPPRRRWRCILAFVALRHLSTADRSRLAPSTNGVVLRSPGLDGVPPTSGSRRNYGGKLTWPRSALSCSLTPSNVSRERERKRPPREHTGT